MRVERRSRLSLSLLDLPNSFCWDLTLGVNEVVHRYVCVCVYGRTNILYHRNHREFARLWNSINSFPTLRYMIVINQ